MRTGFVIAMAVFLGGCYPDIGNSLSAYKEAQNQLLKAMTAKAYACGFTDGRVLGLSETGEKPSPYVIWASEKLEVSSAKAQCDAVRSKDLYSMVIDRKKK